MFDLSAVTLNTDLLWCPDRHRPCRRWDVTFSNNRAWSYPKSVGSPWRNRVQKSNLKAPCCFFEVQPWHSRRSKWANVILSIDILWCPDRQRPSETITFWLSSESFGNRGGIVLTKSSAAKDPAEVKHESTVWFFRDALTFSDVLIGIDFVRGKM